MPVISTETFDMMKGLGLDDARAMRAAAAVGAAKEEADRQALAEVTALRHAVTNLGDRLSADAAAGREATTAALAEATAAQARALSAGIDPLRAELDGLRRAQTAAESARAAADAQAAGQRRLLTALGGAAVGLILLDIVVALIL